LVLGFPIDGAFVLELPALPPQFRRFHPDDVHVTLAFLGGCTEEAALRALAVLDDRLQRVPLPGIGVSLGEVVPMGGCSKSWPSAATVEARLTASFQLVW
jgi:hypothetical protein